MEAREKARKTKEERRATDIKEMATQNAQPQQGSGNKALDVIVMTLAVLIAAAGLFAFTFLTDQSTAECLNAYARIVRKDRIIANHSNRSCLNKCVFYKRVACFFRINIKSKLLL